ncbi:MAG: copper resistance protein B [Methylovulum sp.]|nr:copper resistance protein B [Methylovulum sp.]
MNRLALALLGLGVANSWAEEAMDMGGMDHSKMSHEAMQGMVHDGAVHDNDASPAMQGGSAPPDARDPHAYAEGYGFGDLTHPQMGDEEILAALVVDRLENLTTDNESSMTYDAQAWFGKTYDRAVLRAEGKGDYAKIGDARSEVLWGHALTPFWDTHLGLRYDSGGDVDRSWFAFGVQGLAPYWLYIEATGYIGEQGRAAFRFESEYDLLLTQKLILQPRIEVNFYSQRDNGRAISSGLSDYEAGLRLRYEIRREFAPYVGIEWAGQYGSTVALPSSGNHTTETRLVAGLHFWF